MTPEEFTMIRDFIHEKSGIYFAENKMYLVKNRLLKRMGDLEIKSVRDYFYLVKYDTSMKEFNILMDLVTTNETSFFRNEPQLQSFGAEVLPQIIKERSAGNGPKSLRIWSAGCSSGEEPYTLAMIALDKGLHLTGWKIEIVASDISEEVLAKARVGEYSGLTLRNCRPDVLARHFVKQGDKHKVKPEVKSLINFSHLNLNEERKVSMMTNFDVVFCRNVMIYFSEDVKKRLVRGFYNSLKPGGYLYIGHSETLHGISKAFKLVYFKNALVYTKEQVRPNAITPTASITGSTASSTTLKPTGGLSGASKAIELLSKIKPLTVHKF
jgi:chemotaxis protein methyltransferase CheR